MPAASVALAATVCVPSATVVLFQVAVHGEPFVSAATSTPSTNHLTDVTATLSLAGAPAWRRCRRSARRRQGGTLTVGAVVSGGGAVWLTEKLTDSEAPQLPAVSRAFAMILCAPSATVALFHGFVHGAPSVSVATRTPSTHHSTFVARWRRWRSRADH